MASEFARTLSRMLTADVPDEILRWGERVIDGELQEPREVLNVLIAIASNSSGLTTQEESYIERARQLYSKLQVKE